MSTTPIADHALLSDCRSAALVSKAGSIEWLCFPRFDSPSVFARILDDEAGHWSISPVTDAEITRRYRERTLVLETSFRTATGKVTLIDAMAVGLNATGHDLAASPPRALFRVVRGDEGEVELDLEYEPCSEYGIVWPVLTAVDGGVTGRGGADVLALSSPVPLDIDHSKARGRFTVGAGDQVGFALSHRSTWEEPPPFLDQGEIQAHIDETTEAWQTWSTYHQRYEGPWADLVYHSGTALQGLTYRPTGAFVAAATTSLPEEVGGVRNWDYRYAWVRDASLTMEALWTAACPDEAHEFFAWMAGAVASQLRRGTHLQVMFGLGGERDLTERELPHLSGWRDSRPVRIGNGAWNQRQLDVYGEVLTAAHKLEEQLGDLDPGTREFLTGVADGAAGRWEDRDHGIWEVRDEPRHFVYSKLMCWAALDRAIAMADRLQAGDRVEAWSDTREEIRSAILEHAWSEKAGAFAQYFGGDSLDASNLMMPIVGFLPATDPKMRA
ncbi:MAG TPA: glycoside hydrolase family 15 protein, partial [Actinomycetota bacterium]|nr:glycoside hydrolase family 15 protein [Actinomycetota bacterium]